VLVLTAIIFFMVASMGFWICAENSEKHTEIFYLLLSSAYRA